MKKENNYDCLYLKNIYNVPQGQFNVFFLSVEMLIVKGRFSVVPETQQSSNNFITYSKTMLNIPFKIIVVLCVFI